MKVNPWFNTRLHILIPTNVGIINQSLIYMQATESAGPPRCFGCICTLEGLAESEKDRRDETHRGDHAWATCSSPGLIHACLWKYLCFLGVCLTKRWKDNDRMRESVCVREKQIVTISKLIYGKCRSCFKWWQMEERWLSTSGRKRSTGNRKNPMGSILILPSKLPVLHFYVTFLLMTLDNDDWAWFFWLSYTSRSLIKSRALEEGY